MFACTARVFAYREQCLDRFLCHEKAAAWLVSRKHKALCKIVVCNVPSCCLRTETKVDNVLAWGATGFVKMWFEHVLDNQRGISASLCVHFSGCSVSIHSSQTSVMAIDSKSGRPTESVRSNIFE